MKQGDSLGVLLRTAPRVIQGWWSGHLRAHLCATPAHYARGTRSDACIRCAPPGVSLGPSPGAPLSAGAIFPLAAVGIRSQGCSGGSKRGPRGSYLGPPNPPLSAGPIFPLATVGIRPRGGQKGSKRGPRGHFGVHFGTPSGTPPGRVYTKNLV